jgi:hypothetical protein
MMLLAVPQEAPRLAAGPVLAGGSVVWAEQAPGVARVRASGGRVLYELRAGPTDSVEIQGLAASPQLVAAREQTAHCPPPSDSKVLPCSVARRIVFGSAAGRLVRVRSDRACSGGVPSIGDSVDVWRDVLATSTTYAVSCSAGVSDLRRHVVVGSKVLADADALAPTAPGDVRVAGDVVAWSELGGRRIVVYDRRRRRTMYRAVVTRATGIDVSTGFDVQPDGKLAVAYHLAEVARVGESTVEWWSADGSSVHVLPVRAASTSIRIAGDRIVFVRAGAKALVLWQLRGKPSTLAPLDRPTGDLDFDGARATWASTKISSSRIDCPPPGNGAPCVRRFTGVTTIWSIRLGSRPHAVAELPFADSILPG